MRESIRHSDPKTAPAKAAQRRSSPPLFQSPCIGARTCGTFPRPLPLARCRHTGPGIPAYPRILSPARPNGKRVGRYPRGRAGSCVGIALPFGFPPAPSTQPKRGFAAATSLPKRSGMGIRGLVHISAVSTCGERGRTRAGCFPPPAPMRAAVEILRGDPHAAGCTSH